MATKIINLLIHNRGSVAFALAILFSLGVWAFTMLPIDAVPDITNVQVQVNSRSMSLDPTQLEKSVTYIIETELSGLPNVTDIRSITKFGLSQVTVIFKDGTDIYRARQLVGEKLQALRESLPEGINPEMGPIATGLGEVLMYRLKEKQGTNLAQKSEKEKLLYLRTIHDFVLRPYLKSHITDIAEIDVIGGYKKEIHVDFIPAKMEQYGLTIQDILSKMEGIGENAGGGYIMRDGKQVIVRTDAAFTDLEPIKNIPVKLNIFGAPVLLSQVANVVEGNVERLGAAMYNGRETVLGTVFMLLGANSQIVAANAMNAVMAAQLPADVEAEIVYNRGFLVNATLKTVSKSLAEGAALVVVVLLLILGNFRAAIIVSLAIPISMLFAVIGMERFGISANLMSLGAIDFGLLVDGSVVVIENYLRNLEGKRIHPQEISFQQRIDVLAESFEEIIQPVVFGLMIIMVVYLPILALEGVEGKMFRPMALTVLIALGGSLVAAIVFMPVLAFFVIRFPKHGSHIEKDPLFFRMIKKIYIPSLNFALNYRISMLAGAGVMMVVAAIIFSSLGSDFIPPLDEGDMSIAIVRNYDISLDEALRQQAICEKTMVQFKEVQHVFSRIGVAESATDPMGINMADTFVILNKDADNWPLIDGKRRTKEELFEAIRVEIEKKISDQEILNSQPIELRFNEILEGSRADISLRIYGNDLELLTEKIDQAQEILESVPGASEVEMDPITSLRRGQFLNVKPDYSKMNSFGISIPEVNRTLETAMSGSTIGSLYIYDWRFPIVLRMEESLRPDIRAIRQIPIGLEGGGTIALGQIAQIEQKEQVANIARNNVRRYSAVAINMGDRDVVSYVNEAKEKIAKELTLPEGFQLDWGGQFKNLDRARARLAIIVPLVLIAIFILVLRNIGSVRQTLLVYTGIPFAMTGGFIALFIRDIHFSVSASIGFIALSGIAILNSLVLVTFINQLREQGKPVTEAAISGAIIRLRPVLMTAMVASLGFLPMALNTGIGAEVQRPLATVVIGGLITSTLLTLLLLPVLYIWIEQKNISDGDK